MIINGGEIGKWALVLIKDGRNHCCPLEVFGFYGSCSRCRGDIKWGQFVAFTALVKFRGRFLLRDAVHQSCNFCFLKKGDFWKFSESRY